MKKIGFFLILIVFLVLNYMFFSNIRNTLQKMFVNEVISKTTIIEEASNSIFELISNNEQQFIQDKYKIAKVIDIHSITNKNLRMELMVNYDIHDIMLLRSGKYVVYPRERYGEDFSKIKSDTIFTEDNYLFIANKYGKWIKIFVINMESIAVGNDSLNFGAFLRKIRDKTGIIYFVWQDLNGIIAATGNISRIPSIKSDTFLMDALKSRDYRYRFITFNGQRGVEVVKCINKSKNQLLRICFDAIPLYNGIKKEFVMFLISSVLILLIALAIYVLLYNKRTIEEMTKENLFNREIIKNVFEGIESPLAIYDENGNVVLKNKLYDHINIKKDKYNINEILENNDTVDVAGRIYSVFVSDINVENMNKSFKLVMFIDRTDRIKLERVENERKRQKENEEFISEFAHQVKNPLNAISMATQRLLSNKKFDDNLVRIINDEIGLLNKNISDFLRRIREGGNRKICLNDILSDICNLYRTETESKNIDLQCSIPEKHIYLDIKKMEIMDIMNNLIKNAIESFENDGKGEKYIKVTLNNVNENVLITVEDNGKPINRDVAGKIFDKGYSKKAKGTGLGLYVVKKTVERYGGKIDLSIDNNGIKIFKISFYLGKM